MRSRAGPDPTALFLLPYMKCTSQPGVGRFRANVFVQSQGFGAGFRVASELSED